MYLVFTKDALLEELEAAASSVDAALPAAKSEHLDAIRASRAVSLEALALASNRQARLSETWPNLSLARHNISR